MGRKKQNKPSIRVTITCTPKIGAYLDSVIEEEGYGANRSEVAKNLLWRGIEQLINNRMIDRIKGE